MQRCNRILLVTFALVSVVWIQVATADTSTGWPQWRGPHRDATTSSKSHPLKLDENNLTLLWNVPLGPSYSGPVILKDRVFVTETKDQKYEVVTALDRHSGNILWTQSWEGALTVPPFAITNGSWIRATPAVSNNTIYVAGMRDVLVAIDTNTGDLKWKRDFVADMETALPNFGYVSSPLVDGNSIYTQAGASVLRLDANSGETIWRSLEDDGGMSASAFSSPVILQLAGRRQLVVQTRQKLAGVCLEDGDILWEQPIPTFRGMNILTPSQYGDAVFTASYQGGTFLFDIVGSDRDMTSNEAWTNQAQGYMSSPIIVGDHAYLHMRNGRLTCFDLKTGKRTWTSTPFGKYWSMVNLGKHLLALDERGELLLIVATPDEFQLVDRKEISESSTWAHLAVVDENIYVRSLDALLCFRWSDN
jgi:outer membrane protein assembly factor BamB